MPFMRLFILLFVGVTLAWVTTVQGHSPFQGSVPEDGATIRAGELPETLQLRFRDGIQLATVELQPAEGDVLRLDHPGGMSDEHTVALPDLEADRYVVAWRGVAEDGHAMSGEIQFRVTPE